MGKEVTLTEVSNLPVGGDGIQRLSLELSLGGKRYDGDSEIIRKEIENPFEKHLQNLDFCPRSDFYCVDGDESAAEVKRRRELQALRRREIRRKGEAKAKAAAEEDKSSLERQRFHGRIRDREIKEREDFSLSSNAIKPTDVSDHQSTSSCVDCVAGGGSSVDGGNHTSPSAPSQPNTSPERSNRLLRKPPKPPSRRSRLATPRVSVKGNGPDGKTVTGFLSKYTAAEVVVTCDCHGDSMSPAGFVEHAGCVDVTHPLRHITMVNT